MLYFPTLRKSEGLFALLIFNFCRHIFKDDQLLKNWYLKRFLITLNLSFFTVIQRIQSVYLFLAFVLDGTIFFNTLYTHAMDDPQAWVGMGFTAVLVIAGLFSLISIFLYNNRSNQIKWTGVVVALQTITFGYGVGILISLGGFGMFLWDEAIGAGILLIALIAVFMARKKIKDDEELVRSMDRIR